MRSRYKCCVYHVCSKANILTCDSYFIIKHIIFQIVKLVPAIKDLLLLQEVNTFLEMTESWQREKLQTADLSIFIDFCKVIS